MEPQDDRLRSAVAMHGAKNWKLIAELVGDRSDVQCLHRWQKVLRPGIRKGPWSAEEDGLVRQCVERGMKKWSDIAARLPGRIG